MFAYFLYKSQKKFDFYAIGTDVNYVTYYVNHRICIYVAQKVSNVILNKLSRPRCVATKGGLDANVGQQLNYTFVNINGRLHLFA